MSEAAELVVVGGGMTGREIARQAQAGGRTVALVTGVTPTVTSILPAGVRTVIVTAQSRDSDAALPTADLVFVNVDLVARVLAEAAERGVRRVAVFSTGSVYATGPETLHEDGPLRLEDPTPYVASKLAAELLARCWRGAFERLVLLRPFALYGRGLAPKRLLARLPAMIRDGVTIALHGGRGLITNPIHVEDAARFTLQALEQGRGLDVFNLAGAEVLDLRQMATAMAAHVGRAPVFADSSAPATRLVADTARMRAAGFRHRILFADGCASLVAS